MRTIAEQQRTCSYCGGNPFPTQEAFTSHWNRCPSRIEAGYLPRPSVEMRAEALSLIRQAEALLVQAEHVRA
jgi:hypothetical protein